MKRHHTKLPLGDKSLTVAKGVSLSLSLSVELENWISTTTEEHNLSTGIWALRRAGEERVEGVKLEEEEKMEWEKGSINNEGGGQTVAV